MQGEGRERVLKLRMPAYAAELDPSLTLANVSLPILFF